MKSIPDKDSTISFPPYIHTSIPPYLFPDFYNCCPINKSNIKQFLIKKG